MIWEKAKSAKQLVLDGINIEVDKSDSTLVGVTFTDATGRKVRVRYESYNMCVEIPQAPKTTDKFAVRGTVNGLHVDETFDHEYQANDRKEELTGSLAEEKFDVSVAKTEVFEDILF